MECFEARDYCATQPVFPGPLGQGLMEYLSEAADVWAIYRLGRAALHEDAGQKEGTGCSGLVEARQLLYGEALEEGGGADDEGREPVCQQRVGLSGLPLQEGLHGASEGQRLRRMSLLALRLRRRRGSN